MKVAVFLVSVTLCTLPVLGDSFAVQTITGGPSIYCGECYPQSISGPAPLNPEGITDAGMVYGWYVIVELGGLNNLYSSFQEQRGEFSGYTNYVQSPLITSAESPNGNYSIGFTQVNGSSPNSLTYVKIGSGPPQILSNLPGSRLGTGQAQNDVFSSVNNSGIAVGVSYSFGGNNTPIIYNISTGQLTTLAFPGAGTAGTNLIGINDLGQILGTAAVENSTTDTYYNFIYQNGSFQVLTENNQYTEANGLTPIAFNDSDQILGVEDNELGIYQGGQFTSLNTLIPNDPFTGVDGINNQGQIVGTNGVAGDLVIASPEQVSSTPEPGSFGGVIVAAALFWISRYARSRTTGEAGEGRRSRA